jgi:hypothetical protein
VDTAQSVRFAPSADDSHSLLVYQWIIDYIDILFLVLASAF